MGRVEEVDGAALLEQPRLPRQRPLSAPVRGRDPLLPGPSSSAARGAKTRRRQEQQRWQERRRRPETVSARQGAGCWRRDRDGGRRGGGRDTTIVGESFGCLQARLAKVRVDVVGGFHVVVGGRGAVAKGGEG